MFKQLSILLLICVSSLCALAQTEKYTAPVKWEKYKVSEMNVSVLLPKIPVLVQHSSSCSEVLTNQYAVYAEGAAYGFNISFKTKSKNSKNSKFCQNIEKFDEKQFDLRIKDVKNSLKTESENTITQNNSEVIKVKGDFFTYWLINDFKNKRWFEIWATNKDENEALINDFVGAFKIEKNPSGIEIGKGADRTLGDETTTDKINAGTDITAPIRLILKPVPGYTDAARQMQIQGNVTLRITFLASGGIGSVMPISELPDGLTEQAIAAAKKMVFIPAQKNGIHCSVSKTVQYAFSIY